MERTLSPEAARLIEAYAEWYVRADRSRPNDTCASTSLSQGDWEEVARIESQTKVRFNDGEISVEYLTTETKRLKDTYHRNCQRSGPAFSAGGFGEW